MTNVFEETYRKIQMAKSAYKNATTDAEREEARKAFESVTNSVDNKSPYLIRLMTEYEISRDSGTEMLNIRFSPHENQIEEFIKLMKGNGINEFTFSATWSSSIETAWAFQEAGYKLQGIVEIYDEYKEPFSNDYQKTHAYLFRV